MNLLFCEIIVYLFRVELATPKENVKKDLVFQMACVLKGMVSAVSVRIELFFVIILESQNFFHFS